jgi:hypothetical protein
VTNYIVSYDLNGSTPTHAQMDKHMESAGWTRGRILETVWYVGSSASQNSVYNHINLILSSNDRLIVIKAESAAFRNLLIADKSLIEAWNANS